MTVVSSLQAADLDPSPAEGARRPHAPGLPRVCRVAGLRATRTPRRWRGARSPPWARLDGTRRPTRCGRTSCAGCARRGSSCTSPSAPPSPSTSPSRTRAAPAGWCWPSRPTGPPTPRCTAPATATGCVSSSSAGSGGSTCACGRPTSSVTRPATWPGWSPRPTVPQRSLGPGRRHRAQTRPRRDQRPRWPAEPAAEPAEDTAEDTAEETAKGTDEGTAESRAEDAHAEPAGADRGDEARKRRLVRRRPKVAPEQTRDDTDAGWGELRGHLGP